MGGFKIHYANNGKKTWSEQPKGHYKGYLLTATPFSYVKTLDWAEGICLILCRQPINLTIKQTQWGQLIIQAAHRTLLYVKFWL